MSKKCPILQAAWISSDDFNRFPNQRECTDCMEDNCSWWNGEKCSIVKGLLKLNSEKESQ